MWLLDGPLSGTVAVGTPVWMGAEERDSFGSPLVKANLDGDALDDVLIGAVGVRDADGLQGGAVYGFFGAGL